MFDSLPSAGLAIELLAGLVVVSNVGWLVAFLLLRRKKRKELSVDYKERYEDLRRRLRRSKYLDRVEQTFKVAQEEGE